MGDFNYPNIDWEKLDGDTNSLEFLNLVQDCFLVQHVNVPTRGDNILDLVFTSEDNMVENIEVREHFSSSDHNIIVWTLNCKTVMNENHMINYDYTKADYVKINENIKSINWDIEFFGKNADQMWSKFNDVVITNITSHVPLKKIKNKKYPFWMTRKAIRAQKYKSRMWKRYRESFAYNDEIEYKKARNFTTNVFKKAKKNFEKKLSKEVKCNPKSFYSYIRSTAKTKDRVGPLKDSNGVTVTDDESISKLLNDYFSSVFTDESLNPVLPIVQDLFKEDQSKKLLDFDIIESNVVQRLRGLKVNKAPGVDKIVPKFLIETADYICKPLCLIFRESLNTGIVPKVWRQANVSAIFKKGSKCLPCNYRPISLTSQVCKIFEGLMRDNIVKHLTDFKLIN
jgi:hypothetical protein